MSCLACSNGQRNQGPLVIAVASGKGGTGKTTVATNLALAVSAQQRVQLLDCDVEEPNAHLFLRPRIDYHQPVQLLIPSVDEQRCSHCGRCAELCPHHAIAVFPHRVMVFPELCHGCGACSLFCPHRAIQEIPHLIGSVEVGVADGMRRARNPGEAPEAPQVGFVRGRLHTGEALAVPVVRQVKSHVRDAEVVVIDAAPGTSCAVVEALKGATLCVLVTEPTPFGLHDLETMLELVEKLGLPAGVVLNRADVGDAGVREFCRKRALPILMEIRHDRHVAELYARGIALVRAHRRWADRFASLFERVRALADRGVVA